MSALLYKVKKVEKLTNVINLNAKGTLTYEEALLKHLGMLTDEEKNSKVSGMVIMSDGEMGLGFGIPEGDNMLQIIGMIEVLKVEMSNMIE